MKKRDIFYMVLPEPMHLFHLYIMRRPYRVRNMIYEYPGRCPGLLCVSPSGTTRPRIDCAKCAIIFISSTFYKCRITLYELIQPILYLNVISLSHIHRGGVYPLPV